MPSKLNKARLKAREKILGAIGGLSESVGGAFPEGGGRALGLHRQTSANLYKTLVGKGIPGPIAEVAINAGGLANEGVSALVNRLPDMGQAALGAVALDPDRVKHHVGRVFDASGFDPADIIANTYGIDQAKLELSEQKPIKSYQEGTMPMRSEASFRPGRAEAFQSPYAVAPLGGMGGSAGLFGYMQQMMERQMALKEQMAQAQLKMLKQERMQAEAQLKMAQKRFQREGDIFSRQMKPKSGMSSTGHTGPRGGIGRAQDAADAMKMAKAMGWSGTFEPANVRAGGEMINAIGIPAAHEGLMQTGRLGGMSAPRGRSRGMSSQPVNPSGQTGMFGAGGFMGPPAPEPYYGMPSFPQQPMLASLPGANLQMIPGRTAEKGGRVPKTGTYKLHKDEIVLNKKQSDMMFPKAPRPSGGRPLASYAEGTLVGGGMSNPELGDFYARFRAWREEQMRPILGESAGVAGPGTVEDLAGGPGFSPRSGGGAYGDVGGEAGAMGQRYPGGKPMQTQFPGAQPPIAPVAGRGMAEDLGPAMGFSKRSGGLSMNPEFASAEEAADFIRKQARYATKAEKKIMMNVADDIVKGGVEAAAKYSDDLMRAGKYGKIAAAALVTLGAGAAGLSAFFGADESGAAPTGGGIPGPVSEYDPNMSQSRRFGGALRYGLGQAAGAFGEYVGAPISEFAGGLAGTPMPTPQGAQGETPPTEPPEEAAMPAGPPPIPPQATPSHLGIEGLSKSTGAGGEDKYTLESQPLSDEKKLMQAEANQAYFERTAEHYQTRNDGLLKYMSDNPSPEIMKMYQERQLVVDKYATRAAKEAAKAKTLQKQLSDKEREQGLETIKQFGTTQRAEAASKSEGMKDVKTQIRSTQDSIRGIYNKFLQGDVEGDAFIGGVREELRHYMPFLEYRLKGSGMMREEETIQGFIDQALADAERTGRMDPLEAIFVALDIAAGG